MQNITGVAQESPRGDASYRERLTPSLAMFAAAGVTAPMAALVFAPLDPVVSLAVGVAVAVAVIALLVGLSPVIEVRGGWLYAGRARIDARFLGAPSEYRRDEARLQRGPRLDPRAWHLIRGGIDGLVVVPLQDPDDPVPSWVVSTRTPDRLAAALRRASAAQRATPRTPGR
ncbi:MAG: DUF3093 domain-containing protein [Microbacterium sp.]